MGGAAGSRRLCTALPGSSWALGTPPCFPAGLTSGRASGAPRPHPGMCRVHGEATACQLSAGRAPWAAPSEARCTEEASALCFESLRGRQGPRPRRRPRRPGPPRGQGPQKRRSRGGPPAPGRVPSLGPGRGVASRTWSSGTPGALLAHVRPRRHVGAVTGPGGAGAGRRSRTLGTALSSSSWGLSDRRAAQTQAF